MLVCNVTTVCVEIATNYSYSRVAEPVRSGWSHFGWTTFQEGSKYFSANQKSNPRLRIGLECEPWNTLKNLKVE